MFDNLHLFLKSNKEFDVAYINITVSRDYLAKITVSDITVKTYYTKAHSL